MEKECESECKFTPWDVEGDIDYAGLDSYDYIQGADLTTLNGSLTVGLGNIPDLDYRSNASHTPYFYDFDLNRTISAIEQAIVIQFDEDRGFISEYTENNPITDLTKAGFKQ